MKNRHVSLLVLHMSSRSDTFMVSARAVTVPKKESDAIAPKSHCLIIVLPELPASQRPPRYCRFALARLRFSAALLALRA
jgi:hypothetical protein